VKAAAFQKEDSLEIGCRQGRAQEATAHFKCWTAMCQLARFRTSEEIDYAEIHKGMMVHFLIASSN